MALKQLRIGKQQITARDDPSMEKYLQQVQGLPQLTGDEEVFYTKIIKEGVAAQAEYKRKKKEWQSKYKEAKRNKESAKLQKLDKEAGNLAKLHKKVKKKVEKADAAKKKLVEGNLRFVISVAKHYKNYDLNIQDLINEGNKGLIKAAERFDETRGFKFISYGVWWIRQHMGQACYERGRAIRVPPNRINWLQKLYKTSKRLQKQLERKPTQQEIAEELDIPLDMVISLQEANMKPVSLDAPLKQGEDNTTLADILYDQDASMPDSGLMSNSLTEKLDQMINKLDPRDRIVIRDCFAIGKNNAFSKPLEDIAKKLGLTRERVRQLREGILDKLRKMVKNKSL